MSDFQPTGVLYIVATPIGNRDDISVRAIETLKNADIVLCEERKIGSKLLKQLGLEKPLQELNEHNESAMIQDVLVELMNGKNLALISDCGTPVFSDPGKQLIRLLYEMQLKVVPIPGASALMTAISVCPINLDRFFFLGFLPAKADQRQRSLKHLSGLDYPFVLMDTPYRLTKSLQEIEALLGKKQNIFLAMDMTLPTERFLGGTVAEVLQQVQGRKAEFILIVDRPQRRRL